MGWSGNSNSYEHGLSAVSRCCIHRGLFELFTFLFPTPVFFSSSHQLERPFSLASQEIMALRTLTMGPMDISNTASFTTPMTRYMDKSRHDKHPLHHCKFLQQSGLIAHTHLSFCLIISTLSLFQASNRTVSVANTLSGHIILAERLNYEERTRYLVLVQANVSELICTSTVLFASVKTHNCSISTFYK